MGFKPKQPRVGSAPQRGLTPRPHALPSRPQRVEGFEPKSPLEAISLLGFTNTSALGPIPPKSFQGCPKAPLSREMVFPQALVSHRPKPMTTASVSTSIAPCPKPKAEAQSRQQSTLAVKPPCYVKGRNPSLRGSFPPLAERLRE
jgi:hypothetical protein